MKKQLFLLFFSGLFLFIFSVNSQNSDIPKKNVNGVEYYIYTVQAKEGLYSISKKFNVTQAEISNINPSVENGLKVGQELLIPVKKQESAKNTEYIEHVVEKKQTLFAISRKYEVSQEDILKYNPEINQKLKAGTVIKIPVKKETQTTSVQTEPNQPKNLKRANNLEHIVQKKETLYSISKIYNTNIDDIIALNPGVEKNLGIGTKILIPLKNEIKDTISTKSGILLDFNKMFGKKNDSVQTYKIAFLLPFMLNQNSSNSGNDRFIDFYTGALLAAYKAKENGISLEISTYDTEKTVEKLNEVLLNDELKNMDLIIGPAFSNQVSVITDFAKDNKIMTLIPFSSKVPSIENNPYLFQFNPGTDVEINFTKKILTQNYPNSNIILAEITNVNEFNEGSIVFNSLKNELKNTNLKVTTLKLNNPENTDFTAQLKKDKNNIVIFNSDKYSQVQPYLGSLKTNIDNFDILIFEKYSWLNQAEKSLKGIYISPFSSRFDEDNQSAFNVNYNRYFNDDMPTELPRFDLLGFDLTYYFIDYFQKNGKNINETISNFNASGLIQSQPKFEKIHKGSGYINQQLYLGKINQ